MTLSDTNHTYVLTFGLCILPLEQMNTIETLDMRSITSTSQWMINNSQKEAWSESRDLF